MKTNFMAVVFWLGFKYVRITVLSIVISLSIFMVSFFQTVAQSPEPISVAELKLGSLSRQSPRYFYSLVARAGETLYIEIKRVTGNIIPQFTVLRDTESLGVWYAYQHGSVGDDTAGSQINFDADAVYTIQVTSRYPDSSEGQYALSVNTTTPPSSLTVGGNAEGEIVGGETRVFAFQSIPQSPLLATVELVGNISGVVVRVKNSRNDILGRFEPPLQAGLFNIPQGQKDYTIEIVNQSTGSVIQFKVFLTTLITPDSSEVVIGSDGLPLLPNTGDCVVATRSESTVNIRPEPSMDKPAIAHMSPYRIYPVSARNQDSTWYQIDDNDRVGWVAAIVTHLGGNCGEIPIQ